MTYRDQPGIKYFTDKILEIDPNAKVHFREVFLKKITYLYVSVTDYQYMDENGEFHTQGFEGAPCILMRVPTYHGTNEINNLYIEEFLVEMINIMSGDG